MQRILSGSNRWNRLLPITLILAGAGLTAIALAADLHRTWRTARHWSKTSRPGFKWICCAPGRCYYDFIRQAALYPEWLLVALAGIAVAFTADLLVINGLPDFGSKLLVLASIGFSVLSIGTSFVFRFRPEKYKSVDQPADPG